MTNQFSDITKPVIIIPFHHGSVLLYHAMKDAGIDVMGFWDNDKTLDNEKYDGKNITLPISAKHLQCDITIIIYFKKHEHDIMAQLKSLGFSDFISAHAFDTENINKQCFFDICDDFARIRLAYASKHRRELLIDSTSILPMTSKYREESLDILFNSQKGKRRILMITPHLSINGAEIALLYAARVLLQNGDIPVILCKRKGNLTSTFLENGVPVIIDYKIPENSDFESLVSYFDMVFVNTISLPSAPLSIEKLSFTSIPVLWWVHESNVLFTKEILRAMPKCFGDNIHVYCVGKYAQEPFHFHIPGIASKTLLFGVEDFYEDINYEPMTSSSDKIAFMNIASIEKRKGQDIFCAAIRKMDEHVRDLCEFWFVGIAMPEDDTINEVLALKSDFPESVFITGEAERNEIKRLLHKCGCMVCSSREDSMGMLIAEAMMFHKICICSDNAGVYEFIEDGINGFIYTKDNVDQLGQKMEYVARHFNDLDNIRTKSRDAYDTYFAIDVFIKNLLTIIDELIGIRGTK